MDSTAQNFEALQAAARRIAQDVARVHAAAVDADAAFPEATIEALKRSRLLSAPVPVEFGGAGLGMEALTQLVSTLAGACSSSAMVLAMHYIQVGCIARHAKGSAFFASYLREISERQWLLASMTSEVGTFGDTRSSICAVQLQPASAGQPVQFRLDKDATTGSYCAQADAILVTARKAPDAAASDQVLVLVRRGDYELTQTTTWDTLGMRGTRSPGFKLVSHGAAEQILPESYADISAHSMVPFSHILWSSLWWGIAAEAQSRAAAFVRGQARKSPGVVPPTALLLADLNSQMQTMRHHWQSLALEFDRVVQQREDATVFTGLGWALKMNNLKIACSELAPRLVHAALQIVGILGYKNDGPFSMGRLYRDALSGSLMVSNERIAAKSASMLLVFKDE
jgi:acyl-CoA dehydrogenase